jgi:hypothetical protein
LPAPSAPAPLRACAAYAAGSLVGPVGQVSRNRLLAIAAGVVFYGLLALFPAITALVSTYGLFTDSATRSSHPTTTPGLLVQKLDCRLSYITAEGYLP